MLNSTQSLTRVASVVMWEGCSRSECCSVGRQPEGRTFASAAGEKPKDEEEKE